MIPFYDSISAQTLVRLPGLIDVHVHMREPGSQAHKETWTTGTRAAVAGGVTMVLAMPNTQPPLIDEKAFEDAEKVASHQALCDYALYVGATSENFEQAKAMSGKCAGLKMYLNHTFNKTTLTMESTLDWLKVCTVSKGSGSNHANLALRDVSCRPPNRVPRRETSNGCSAWRGGSLSATR